MAIVRYNPQTLADSVRQGKISPEEARRQLELLRFEMQARDIARRTVRERRLQAQEWRRWARYAGATAIPAVALVVRGEPIGRAAALWAKERMEYMRHGRAFQPILKELEIATPSGQRLVRIPNLPGAPPDMLRRIQVRASGILHEGSLLSILERAPSKLSKTQAEEWIRRVLRGAVIHTPPNRQGHLLDSLANVIEELGRKHVGPSFRVNISSTDPDEVIGELADQLLVALKGRTSRWNASKVSKIVRTELFPKLAGTVATFHPAGRELQEWYYTELGKRGPLGQILAERVAKGRVLMGENFEKLVQQYNRLARKRELQARAPRPFIAIYRDVIEQTKRGKSLWRQPLKAAARGLLRYWKGAAVVGGLGAAGLGALFVGSIRHRRREVSGGV